MLPLSYSFSSAISFERGKFERIPIRQIVKDWYTNLVRSRTRDDKARAKEMAKMASWDPGPPPLSYSGGDNISSSFLDLSEELESLSVECSTSPKHILINCEFDSWEDHIASKPILENSQKIEEKSEDISSQSITGDNKTEFLSDICLLTSTRLSSQENNLIVSNSSGDKKCELGVKCSLFEQHEQPMVSNKLKEKKPLSLTELITDKQTKTKPQNNLGNISLHSSKQNTNACAATSKLASLASAHLKQVGQSLPLSIEKSKSSPSNSQHSSFTSSIEGKPSLSALASAHLVGKLTSGDRPSISSLLPRSLSINSNKAGPDGKKLMPNSTNLPPLSIGNQKLNSSKSYFDNSLTLEHVEPILKSSISLDSQREISPLLLEESKEINNSMKSAAENSVSMAIDLTLALTTKNLEEHKSNLTSKPSDIVYPDHYSFTINSQPELIPDLMPEEKKLFSDKPLSPFGKTFIIYPGRTHMKNKLLSIKNVTTQFHPFDFSCQSPDDIVQEALLKKDYAELCNMEKKIKTCEFDFIAL